VFLEVVSIYFSFPKMLIPNTHLSAIRDGGFCHFLLPGDVCSEFAGAEEWSLSYVVLLGVVTTGGEFVAGSCRGTWASARRKCGNFPG